MNKSYSESYKSSGVDITAGYESVKLMKQHIARTMRSEVLDEVGGFGGMFELDLKNIAKPVLVSGTDGVGTKLKVAFIADKHDTVGIDCVAMCVNDIICCGAEPLYFLDYIACGKNKPEKIASIVSGVAQGCVEAGCALIGGETAEMPGMYLEDEYDLAGYSTGIVDKTKIFDKNNVKEDNVLIALPSSGLHSNGFSLVRKVFGIHNTSSISKYYDELSSTLGEELLKPTKIYVQAVAALKEAVAVKALANITGGGFFENIPRALPKGISVKIEKKAVKVLPIFEVLAQKGNISERDMFNTFNMGVGMVCVVDKTEADKALGALNGAGIKAYVLGHTVKSEAESEVILL